MHTGVREELHLVKDACPTPQIFAFESVTNFIDLACELIVVHMNQNALEQVNTRIYGWVVRLGEELDWKKRSADVEGSRESGTKSQICGLSTKVQGRKHVT